MSAQPQRLPLPAAQLPLSQLESLKFKTNQILESIDALMQTLGVTGPWAHAAYLPDWPEILSKFNLILSQTHNFSHALLNPYPTRASGALPQPSSSVPENIYKNIAVYPDMGMSDPDMERHFYPILSERLQESVYSQENETVHRLSGHMSTRGVMGVMGISPPSGSNEPAPIPFNLNGFNVPLAPPPKPEYEDVLRECAEIRDAHDQRIERAMRAVAMLKEKFEWKMRIAEPNDVDWDEDGGMGGDREGAGGDAEMRMHEDIGMDSGDDDEDDDSNEEDEVNDSLVDQQKSSPAPELPLPSERSLAPNPPSQPIQTEQPAENQEVIDLT